MDGLDLKSESSLCRWVGVCACMRVHAYVCVCVCGERRTD